MTQTPERKTYWKKLPRKEWQPLPRYVYDGLRCRLPQWVFLPDHSTLSALLSIAGEIAQRPEAVISAAAGIPPSTEDLQAVSDLLRMVSEDKAFEIGEEVPNVS